MHNFWLIARHEYRKLASKRSFFVATLGIPLLIVLVMGVAIFLSVSNQNDRPLGYIDQAGILRAGVSPETAEESTPVALQPFPDEAAARQALEQEQIQAYFVLPPDYLQTRQLKLYSWNDPPNAVVQETFLSFIRASLAASLPPAVQPRLVAGPLVTIRSLDGSREMGSGNFLNIILPFAIAFLFFFTVMTSAGYLLQVVADEKENRTIEILITSLSPEELIGGKAVGLMAVSLTQLAVWLLAIAAGFIVGAPFLEAIRLAQIPWTVVLVAVLYFLPAYALIAAMMTAIGGAVTEMRQGQQIAGILNLLFALPLMLSALVFTDPDSPVLVLLTLFPTTSFVTVMLRWSTSVIPVWQVVASWTLLTGSAVLGMWASARIFRAGMLRYGQRLDLRAALSAVRFPGA
jgi:ABC-2 type transport system permease protein